MAAAIIYIIKWAVALTLFHSLYGLFMRRETFHALNRAVLIFILVASAALPLCHIETSRPSPIAEATASAETFIIEQAYDEPATTAATTTQPPRLALWPRLLAMAYAAGVAVGWLAYMRSLASLWLLMARSRRIRTAAAPRSASVLVSGRITVACSWMRWVILPEGLEGRQLRSVLTHELSHVRLGHSWDMLLCEFTARMLWFLPSAWLLRKDLRDVHEYQADSHVLASGIDSDSYLRLLIAAAAGSSASPAANAFNHSPIKKRLYMMCRKPSAKAAALKAAYLLPIVGMAVAAFARPTIVADIGQRLATEEAEAPLLSPKALNEAVAGATAQPPAEAAEPGPPAVDEPQPEPVAEPAPTEDFSTDRAIHVVDSIAQGMGMSKIGSGTYLRRAEGSIHADTIRIGEIYLDGSFLLRFNKNAAAKPTRRSGGQGNAQTFNVLIKRGGPTGYTCAGFSPVGGDGPAKPADKPQAAPGKPVRELDDTEIVPLTLSEYRRMHHKYWIETYPDETHLVMLKYVDRDRQLFRLDGVTRYIEDRKTGDRYMCRGIKGYGKTQLEGYITGRKGSIVKFTLIFPPLDKHVETIAVRKKDERSVTPVRLDDVIRRPAKIIR